VAAVATSAPSGLKILAWKRRAAGLRLQAEEQNKELPAAHAANRELTAQLIAVTAATVTASFAAVALAAVAASLFLSSSPL
jgi:hypothetical protein